jgi:hypothetical protein
MNALKIALVAIALMTGVAAAQAGKEDGCISKSQYGIWDCR